MNKKTKVKYKLIDEINGVGDQINSILNLKQKDRYFEGIAIIHSLIEDVLKWLVFIQILWNKSGKLAPMQIDEVGQINTFCNQLNFSSLINLALSVELVDYSLFKKIDGIRKERNSIVHQYWLYIHRGKKHILRKKLEKLANVANVLVGKINNLIEETGMDESYGLFEVSFGKKFI